MLMTTLFALGCAAAEPSRDAEPTTRPVVSTVAHVSATAPSGSGSAQPTAVTPSASESAFFDGPLPSAWGCPPIEAPIEHVVDTEAKVLAASGAELFWADDVGVFARVKDGAPKKLVGAIQQLSPEQLVVTDDALLLLSSREVGSTCTSTVRSISRTPPYAAKTLFSGRCIAHLAVSKTHLAYLVTSYDPVGQWTSGHAYLQDLSKPGAPTKLDFDLPEQGALALTSTMLFASHGGGRVYAARLDNPTRFELVTQATTLRFSFMSQDMGMLDVDDAAVHFLSSGSSNTAIRLFRVKKEGGVPEVVGLFPRDTARPPGPAGFVTSGRYLYFSVPAEGAIYRADKQGKCGIERVADGRKNATGLAFADGAIHWTEASKPPAIYRRRE